MWEIVSILSSYNNHVSIFSRNILKIIYEIYPELDGCDIYMEDRYFSKMYDRDLKQILLDMNYEPELIIVYPELLENLE